MLNQQALDSLYSATYLEDYLDCVENLPDDIQRNISRMRDLDIQYQDYMKELESAMEYLMEEIDQDGNPEQEQDDEEDALLQEALAGAMAVGGAAAAAAKNANRRGGNNGNNGGGGGRRRYVKARATVQEILMKAQDIGDEKLQLAQNVQDNIENKARQLELDKKNLGECTKLRPREYGREMENQETLKEERPSGIKRARRTARIHEVFVPSIMGPSTLEVTSYLETSLNEGGNGPSTSSGLGASSSSSKQRESYQSHSNEKNSSSSGGSGSGGGGNSRSSAAHSQQHEDHHLDRKSSTASQPDESLSMSRSGGGRGSERNSGKNNDRDSESGSGGNGNGGGTRASERGVSTSNASPAKKATQKGKEDDKKGKKRKSTKQNKSQDFSPPDDNDAIDPDEPTYCLCDQISYGEMIGCDNDLCPIEWFHFSCVNLTHKPKGKWYCPRCRGDKPNVMKNRTVLIKELAKYNREREEKA